MDYNEFGWADYEGSDYVPLGPSWDPQFEPALGDPSWYDGGVGDYGDSYYTPSAWSNPGWDSYSQPSPAADYYITNESIARSVPAPGTGSYSIGGGAPQSIYAPGGGGYTPAVSWGQVSPSNVYGAGGAPQWGQMAPVNYTPQPSRAPSSGGGGQQQQPQKYSGKTQMPQINLGGPGGPVWDRLQAVMADPTKMTTDPAFSFLYNQGLQALNRSLAAQRLTHSGKALTDTLNYGQGAAANYFNQLIPQLRGVAGDEYQRWAGPAQMNLQAYGLGQRDTANQIQATAMNNRLLADERGEQMLSDLLPMLAGGGGGNTQGGMLPSSGGGIGWGGMSQMYNPVGRTLQQDWQPPQLEGEVNAGPVQQYYQPEDLAELYL